MHIKENVKKIIAFLMKINIQVNRRIGRIYNG